MAALLSNLINTLPTDQVQRINLLLDRIGLPARLPPDSQPAQLLELIYADKKTESGTLTFITIDGIGKAAINRDITDQQVVQVLEQFV